MLRKHNIFCIEKMLGVIFTIFMRKIAKLTKSFKFPKKSLKFKNILSFVPRIFQEALKNHCGFRD